MADASPNAAPSPNASAGSPPQRGPMSWLRAMSPIRRTIILTSLAIVVIGCAGAVLAYYRYAGAHVSTDDAFLMADIAPVSARVRGSVRAVLVADNQPVHEGDLLVQLDPSDFEAALEASNAEFEAARHAQRSAALEADLIARRTVAQVAQAQASVEQADAAKRTAQALIDQATQMLKQAEANSATALAHLAQTRAEARARQADAQRDAKTLRRTREANDVGAATQQELDDASFASEASAASAEAAQLSVSVAQAEVDEAQATAETARRDLDVAQSRAEEAKAASSAARARLDEAKTGDVASQAARARASQAQAEVRRLQAVVTQNELNLSYSTITAPIDGRVARKTVEPGQNVAVGQTLLAVVGEEVWVEANYKETDLGRIRVGMRVDITVDSYPGVSFAGRVDSVQSGSGAVFSLLPPENATGSYVKVVQRVPVKIVLERMPDASEYFLAPGMSVVPTVLVHSVPRSVDGSATRQGSAASGSS
jgi:membrane fusion protein (multidrug efflux system)